MLFPELLQQELDKKHIPKEAYDIFSVMYEAYRISVEKEGMDIRDHQEIFQRFLRLAKGQFINRYQFEPYHKRIVAPVNYFQFGIDLFYHLVDRKNSLLLHLENVKKMVAQIDKGENVVLLANHQTEVDPQLINIVLEKSYSQFAAEMIFIAGDRVISDPIAIPLSMGTNLLCIYSKRHINNHPEKKEEKLTHNQKTMQKMCELLTEGGKAIYMAPSGGRDRRGSDGEIQIAPFDPQSIEMFRLMAHKAKTPTHFYPLALNTYDILPPPDYVKSDLGERRTPTFGTAHFAFGEEVDMDNFPGSDLKDRHEKRIARAEYIWGLVKQYYHEFL
ncbi:MAG: 1-acyl-sn-glycerol-3-phosphate acyltransferase [Chlamydiales bacterium]